MEISKIRESIAGLPRASNGKLLRIPNEIRTEIIRELSEYGGSREEFAKEVGVAYVTVMGWIKPSVKKGPKPKPPARFQQVQIKTETFEKRFALEGPRGLKVVGLSVSELAILFKEVSCEL